MRLGVVAEKLEELVGQKYYTPRIVGPEPQEMAEKMEPGDILLLENLRFHGEEEKMTEFAKKLASLADIYVMMLGTAHRAHASTAEWQNFYRQWRFIDANEIGIMGKALENPERPLWLF